MKDATRKGASRSKKAPITRKKVSKVAKNGGSDKTKPKITKEKVISPSANPMADKPVVSAPPSTAEVKPAKEKHAGGRPTAYRDDYPEMARKFCLLGADDADLARMFEVDERTINNWKDAHPEFFQSIKEGKDIADSEVASKLYHRAVGYTHPAVKIVADAKTGAQHVVPYTEHYPPETAAGIFWLKNRQRAKWRDKVEQEVTGPNGGPQEVLVAQGDPSDFGKLRAALQARA